jgi:plastocyanin
MSYKFATLGILLLVISTGVLSACSAQLSNSQTESSSQTTTQQADSIMANSVIEIRQLQFAPQTITVKPGEVVAVNNRDSIEHTVTSTQTGAFDTGLIAPGKTVTFAAPLEPGTYEYFCSQHPEMKAKLVVKEGL